MLLIPLVCLFQHFMPFLLYLCLLPYFVRLLPLECLLLYFDYFHIPIVPISSFSLWSFRIAWYANDFLSTIHEQVILTQLFLHLISGTSGSFECWHAIYRFLGHSFDSRPSSSFLSIHASWFFLLFGVFTCAFINIINCIAPVGHLISVWDLS